MNYQLGRAGRVGDMPSEFGRDQSDDAFWTFAAVEERLVEAWVFLGRMPDREANWLRAGVSSIYRSIVREWNDYWQTDDKPVRLGLRSAEVDRMNEALGWLDHVRPADRKLVGFVLQALARGHSDPPWRGLCRPMGWGGHPDALRKRYSRAISRVCYVLNSADFCHVTVSSPVIRMGAK
jgi:hypothetical protein